MSIHIDVFCAKENKFVYVTVIYRCDQGASSIISVAEKVLDQFYVDKPLVKKRFTKSDKAACYHGTYSA